LDGLFLTFKAPVPRFFPVIANSHHSIYYPRSSLAAYWHLTKRRWFGADLIAGLANATVGHLLAVVEFAKIGLAFVVELGLTN